MADHKFKIGQTVFYRPRLRQTDTPLDNRPYQVIQILSAPVGKLQYRIKSEHGEREFVARESELRTMLTFIPRR